MDKNAIETMDVNILLSMINMKLRDEYPSLIRLCEDWDVNEEDIINRMSKNGYEYNEQLNQFR